MLFDWNATVYGNRTDNDQIKTYNNQHHHAVAASARSAMSGNNSLRLRRRQAAAISLDTVGLDVNNTSRFKFGDWRNAVTYGFDAFHDEVETLRHAAAIPISRRPAASARCPAASCS